MEKRFAIFETAIGTCGIVWTARGIAAVEDAAFGTTQADHVTRFFRFPGFASNPVLLARLEQRRMVVFGADLWASDWNPTSGAIRDRSIPVARNDPRGGWPLAPGTGSFFWPG